MEKTLNELKEIFYEFKENIGNIFLYAALIISSLGIALSFMSFFMLVLMLILSFCGFPEYGIILSSFKVLGIILGYLIGVTLLSVVFIWIKRKLFNKGV